MNEIKCYLKDHITSGKNNIRFVGRFFPDLNKEFDLRFLPVDKLLLNDTDEINSKLSVNWAVSSIWKYFSSENVFTFGIIFIHYRCF